MSGKVAIVQIKDLALDIGDNYSDSVSLVKGTEVFVAADKRLYFAPLDINPFVSWYLVIGSSTVDVDVYPQYSYDGTNWINDEESKVSTGGTLYAKGDWTLRGPLFRFNFSPSDIVNIDYFTAIIGGIGS